MIKYSTGLHIDGHLCEVERYKRARRPLALGVRVTISLLAVL